MEIGAWFLAFTASSLAYSASLEFRGDRIFNSEEMKVNWIQVGVTMIAGVIVFFITKELEQRYYDD